MLLKDKHPVSFQIAWNFDPRTGRHKPKEVTRRHKGGRGLIGPPLSTFDTIHPIDLRFCTYNKLSLYFQLIKTLRCLIGFHGYHSHINDVTSGRHLEFSNFQIFFIFELNPENGEKPTFSDWNLQNCKIHCKKGKKSGWSSFQSYHSQAYVGVVMLKQMSEF